MSQSRMASLLEAKINTAVGFVISILSWVYIVPVVFPYLEPHSGWGTATGVTLFFTIMSIGRNYFVRRLFNYRSNKL